MSRGDTETLARVLSDGFTLTHMTGYVQPKTEWLSQMREARFVYHSIDEKHMTLNVRATPPGWSHRPSPMRRCTARGRTGGCN